MSDDLESKEIERREKKSRKELRTTRWRCGPLEGQQGRKTQKRVMGGHNGIETKNVEWSETQESRMKIHVIFCLRQACFYLL